MNALPVVITWDRRVRVRGSVTFQLGRTGETLVADWPGIGRLACATDGSRRRFSVVRGAPRARVDKIRTGAVRALVRDVRGGLSFHASAVADGRRAILLVGPSGSGKSTAAAELCLHHGALLLADDVAILDVSDDRVEALPTERAHYLTPASCRLLGIRGRPMSDEKRIVSPPRRARGAYAVTAIAILRFDARLRGATVRRLTGVAAVSSLVRSVIRFDLRAARSRELDQLALLCRHCDVVELARPRTSGASRQTLDLMRSLLTS